MFVFVIFYLCKFYIYLNNIVDFDQMQCFYPYLSKYNSNVDFSLHR